MLIKPFLAMCVICFCQRQCTCYLYVSVWRDCYTNMSRQKTKIVYCRHSFSSSLLVRMGLALHSCEDNQTYSNGNSVSIIRLPRKLYGFSWPSFFFPVQIDQATISRRILWNSPCGKLSMKASTVQLVWSWDLSSKISQRHSLASN